MLHSFSVCIDSNSRQKFLRLLWFASLVLFIISVCNEEMSLVGIESVLKAKQGIFSLL